MKKKKYYIELENKARSVHSYLSTTKKVVSSAYEKCFCLCLF